LPEGDPLALIRNKTKCLCVVLTATGSILYISDNSVAAGCVKFLQRTHTQATTHTHTQYNLYTAIFH